MKKTLLINLKYIAFGIVLATSASYALAEWGIPAGTYAGPTGQFPNNNTPFVLNVGATDQVKVGEATEAGLTIGSWFSALSGAQFDGSTVFNGPLRGGTPAETTGTVSFGGNGVTTNVSLTGGISNSGTVTNGTLATGAVVPVCANPSGVLVICNTSTPPPSVPAGGAIARLYVNGSSQIGTNVVIRNSDNANVYTIELPLGTNMGMSDVYQVDPGSYNITSSDISCLPTLSPVPLPGDATDFYLNPGDDYIIELNC